MEETEWADDDGPLCPPQVNGSSGSGSEDAVESKEEAEAGESTAQVAEPASPTSPFDEPRPLGRVLSVSSFSFAQSKHLQKTISLERVRQRRSVNSDEHRKKCVKTDTPVVHVDDVPEYMRTWNPYITKGYRLCARKRDCFASLFYWHNCWLDAVTAMTNLLHAFILVVYALNSLPLDDDSRFVFWAFFITAVLHSPPSAAYHLIGCSGKSYRDYVLYQRADFLMIFVSSVPLAFSLGYFTFYELPWCLAVSVAGVIASATYVGYHLTEDFSPSRRIQLISALVFFYLLPVFYQIGFDLIRADAVSSSTYWGTGAILSLGFGAYCYGAKFPECVRPDFPLGSHSVMHLTVNIAYFCEFGFIVSRFYAWQAKQNSLLWGQGV